MPACEVERELVGAHADAVVMHLAMTDVALWSSLLRNSMGRINYIAAAQLLVPVQLMPTGVPAIFDFDLLEDTTDASA
jgi:hypothetical protein